MHGDFLLLFSWVLDLFRYLLIWVLDYFILIDILCSLMRLDMISLNFSRGLKKGDSLSFALIIISVDTFVESHY